MTVEQVKERLDNLKKEFEIGQVRLQELERQRLHLQETLLRISGAVQVLGEMLAEEERVSSSLPVNNSALLQNDVAER